MRDTARATTTSQPTNRVPNEPAMDRNANFGPNLVVLGQKIIFFTGKLKSFVTHMTENPPRHLVHIGFWSGIGKNVQKMAIFGKSFGTNITENHLDNLSALFLGQALDQMGQKCRYLAKNASFGPNLAVFGPKIQFFGGRE